MRERKIGWDGQVTSQYTHSVYEIAAALLPPEGNSDQDPRIQAVRERNEECYKKLEKQKTVLLSQNSYTPEALITALEPFTMANMSEIVAYAISQPRGLVGLKEDHKRELLRCALEHDISQFKVDEEDEISLPASGVVYPTTLKPVQILELRKQRLSELTELKEIPSTHRMRRPTLS